MTLLPPSQSVSLSYLLPACLTQCISSLLQAVLTFRQAGPFQRELLAHTRLDNLVSSELCLLPSFPNCLSLFHSHVCLSLCVCVGSPFLSCHASFSSYLFLFYIWGVFATLSPTLTTHLFSALFSCFSQLPSLCLYSVPSVTPWHQVVQQER